MRLRSIYAAPLAHAEPAVASASFGRNAALYPRARDQRVGRVGLDVNASLSAGLAKAVAEQGRAPQPGQGSLDALRPVTKEQIEHAIAVRQAPELVAPSDWLNHSAGTTAAPIANNATFDASLTVTGTDYQLLSLIIPAEMQGIRITSFKIGREMDRIVSGEMAIDGFSALVNKFLSQPKSARVRRDDVITLLGINRSGGPLVITATWNVRDLDPKCTER